MRDALHRKLGRLEGWLDARPVRERALVGAGAVAVALALWSLLMMDPVMAPRETLRRQTAEVEQEMAGLEAEARAIREAHETDPNAPLRERAGALRGQIERLDRSIQAHTVAMVTPAQMARFLEEMLGERTDLRLVRLENLGAQPLFEEVGDAEEGAERAAGLGVFKHVFEVELEGRYLSTLAYLESLEALPFSFFWEALDYEVEEYPGGRATIRAYTLGADEEWIGV